MYSGGAIARCYTGFLDGKLSQKRLKAFILSRPSRSTRRAQNAEIRKYERRRKKHDQWIDPKGKRPEKKVKLAIPPPLEPKETFPATVNNDTLFIDIHHTDRGKKVLYRESEMTGEFSFRDTILEQLDRYFVYIARMKRSDADAYNLYRQIGAILIPYLGTASIFCDLFDLGKNNPPDVRRNVSPWFRKTLPAFGCLAYGTSPEIERLEKQKTTCGRERWEIKFLYFTRYEKPPVNIEWGHGGTHYILTSYWDKPEDRALKRGGIPQSIGIFVAGDGSVRVLKSLKTKWLKYQIPQRAWSIPEEYVTWARQHELSVQEHIADLFCGVARHIEDAAYAMIRVEARKHNLSACFQVDLARVPYFFSDRDFFLTPSGFRKPIFHSVRAHTRKDGSSVRFHFRGHRRFTWGDYQIFITVPGRDHVSMESASFGAYDIDHPEIVDMHGNLIDSKEVGRKLRDHIHSRKSI